MFFDPCVKQPYEDINYQSLAINNDPTHEQSNCSWPACTLFIVTAEHKASHSHCNNQTAHDYNDKMANNFLTWAVSTHKLLPRLKT